MSEGPDIMDSMVIFFSLFCVFLILAKRIDRDLYVSLPSCGDMVLSFLQQSSTSVVRISSAYFLQERIS